MIRDFKQATFQVLCIAGVDHLVRRRKSDQLLIVGYHGIVRDDLQVAPSWLMLPSRQFERQVEYLKANYDVIFISEAAERIRDRKPFTKPTACITFDDGYENNLTVAAPILREA